MARIRDLLPIWRLERLGDGFRRTGRRWRDWRSATADRKASRRFLPCLIRRTGNFSSVTWLGRPVWQNILDLWTIQETISEIRPALLVECGTNRGGSAYFFASLFDLLGRGEVLTIDLKRMHDIVHPRIEWILGSSISPAVLARVGERVSSAQGPVMVVLDSDHTEAHVFREMECYGPLVTSGSFMLVQDGVIDTLPMFRRGRPGPLAAIQRFLRTHAEFEVDAARSERFLVTHHPMGWLRRK